MSRYLAALAVSTALLAPAAATARPVATAAVQCGSYTTKNGGGAWYVNAIGVKCSKAGKIARLARGKRYTAYGFKCKPKRSAGISGLSYNCTKRGLRGGVGFIYKKP